MSIWKPYELMVYDGITPSGKPSKSVLSFATRRERAEFVRDNPQFEYPYYDISNDVIQIELQIMKGANSEQK